MTASPSDGSDMFMSCADNSGFEASDIPLSQDSEASQSPGILPLLTQAPNQSFSDDEESDEFHSQSPQVETVRPIENVTATPPTEHDTRDEPVQNASDKWIRPDLPPTSNAAKKGFDGSPFSNILEEKKLPDTPAAAAGPMEAQDPHYPVNNDILSSSPEGMVQPVESASTENSPAMMSNTFFMTQSPHHAFNHQAESSDGFNGDNGEPLSSQPSPTNKSLSSQPSPTNKATTPLQGSNETADMDMDSGEPFPSQPASAIKTATTPLQGSAPSSQYDSSSDEASSPDESRTSPPSEEQPKSPTAYMKMRQRNVDRNKQRLISLGLAKKAQTPISTIASPDEKCVATPLPTGMLFSSPCNESSSTTNKVKLGDPACIARDTGADIDFLYERYPHREFQIKTLVSLVGTAMGQTVCQGNVPYVPPPIFVSGPSGTGKTNVVRDVVDTLQRYHVSQLDASVRRAIGTAYVNCAAIEPSSLEAVLESAYNQLAPPVVSTRRARHSKRPKKKLKRKKETTCGLPEVKQLNAEGDNDAFDSTLEDGDMCIQPNNDAEYNSDNEAEMEDKMEAFKTQLGQADVDEKEDADSTENPPSRRKTRHSMNGAVGRKRQTPDRGVPKAREKSMRKVESITKSHGAPVAFGRVLAPLFGLPSHLTPEQKPGSAFLILDHAERLFTLSATQKAESDNFLAQLLLLPQVMGLNLTLIIVSRSALLDCSRINNSASVQKSLGTISNGVHPVRVHFTAYKGKGVFKTILKQPNIVELIVGRQNHLFESKQKDLRHNFQQSTIDSFVETVVQSLSSVTRDIREMIRIGRALWATYILPLDPRNLRTTLEAAKRRRSKRHEQTESARNDIATEDIEALQKELLALLDEAILPRMKRCLEDDLFMLKGDDTHPDFSGTGSAVAPRESSCQYDQPYLSKCLLLAAFVCQSNKPDKDKALFTIQKNGKKNNRQGHRVGNNDADGLAYGSTAWEQQRLKMLRPRSFPLERMLSVFVSIVGLIGGEEKLRLSTNSTADPRELLHAIGSTCFFENLARLREIGLLHEVQGSSTGGGDGFTSFDGINMLSTKYWCELNRNDAEALAASVDFPLENFLL